MLHVRRQIVLAVIALLRGRTAAGDKVYAGRAAPVQLSKAPFLLVYGRREPVLAVSEDDDGRRQQRDLVLTVEAVASSGDDDAAADALALEVETAMAVDVTLGGLAKDIELTATELDGTAEGESRIGRPALNFTIEYHTTAGRPDTPLA